MGWVVLLVGTLAAGDSVADEGPCRAVDCSGHGVCMTEAQTPFCYCETGFAAVDLSCEPTEEPAPSARRSSISAAGQIVFLASREAQRGPQWVGRSREDVSALREHIEPGQMWCSDFVSWIYQQAGVPFTGGYDGGWHLTNNFAIRRWFQERELWIDRDHPAWDTFEPQAGDYLRMHTRSGNGHSGIVRYTTPRGVLYTVEGNVGNRVRLRRWSRFRERRRIDGFGIVIRPEERRAALGH